MRIQVSVIMMEEDEAAALLDSWYNGQVVDVYASATLRYKEKKDRRR